MTNFMEFRLFPRSSLLSSQEAKKHYSTLDRSSAFWVGFAFSFNHPEWAKGNFLVFRFLGQKEDFISGISPASIQFAADDRYIPNPRGMVKFQESRAWIFKGGRSGRIPL